MEHATSSSLCRRFGLDLQVVITIGLMVLGGCTTLQQERMVRTHMEAGEYEQAVQLAREALDQDPENPAYLDLLSDAQTAAADHHFEQAQQLMAARRPAEALERLNRALEHMPAHPGANLARVEAEQAALQGRELAERARDAAAQGDYAGALAQAQAAHDVDEGNTAGRELMTQRSILESPYRSDSRAPHDALVASPGIDAVPEPEPVALEVGKREGEQPLIEVDARPRQQRGTDRGASLRVGRSRPLIRVEPSRSFVSPVLPNATFWSTPRHIVRVRKPLVLPPRHIVSPTTARPPPARPTQIAGYRSAEDLVSASRVPPTAAEEAVTNKRPTQVYRGVISRREHRYRKHVAVVDGISIKLKDTDDKPLAASFEIMVGKLKTKPKDVPPGGKIEMRGASGRRYVMHVIWINHDQKTVHFSVDRLE